MFTLDRLCADVALEVSILKICAGAVEVEQRTYIDGFLETAERRVLVVGDKVLEQFAVRPAP